MNPITQIAENHIRITRPLFSEAMRATENKAYKKAVHKTALVVIALYLAAAVWLLYTGGSLFFLLGESVFLGAILFWLAVMLPNTRMKRKYKAMAQYSNAAPERTVIFFHDYLSVTADTGKETVIPYTDIEGWQESRHLYILNCSHNIHVMLDKNGFILGDFQSVQSLLTSH